VHNQHGSIIGAVETFEEMQPAASPDRRQDSMRLPVCVDDVKACRGGGTEAPPAAAAAAAS
jgi:hypothetical protein